MSDVPPKSRHLGGHGFKTWVDSGALGYLVERFNIASVLDVGCGPGGMRDVAIGMGLEWVGIEGDTRINSENVLTHDFTEGVLPLSRIFDCAWSVEFLEHIEEKYLGNVMAVFGHCRHVVCTAAPPGWGGHHHVNEQSVEYWVGKFGEVGFAYDKEVTQEMLGRSTMAPNRNGPSFLQVSGMYFSNQGLA